MNTKIKISIDQEITFILEYFPEKGEMKREQITAKIKGIAKKGWPTFEERAIINFQGKDYIIDKIDIIETKPLPGT